VPSDFIYPFRFEVQSLTNLIVVDISGQISFGGLTPYVTEVPLESCAPRNYTTYPWLILMMRYLPHLKLKGWWYRLQNFAAPQSGRAKIITALQHYETMLSRARVPGVLYAKSYHSRISLRVRIKQAIRWHHGSIVQHICEEWSCPMPITSDNHCHVLPMYLSNGSLLTDFYGLMNVSFFSVSYGCLKTILFLLMNREQYLYAWPCMLVGPERTKFSGTLRTGSFFFKNITRTLVTGGWKWFHWYEWGCQKYAAQCLHTKYWAVVLFQYRVTSVKKRMRNFIRRRDTWSWNLLSFTWCNQKCRHCVPAGLKIHGNWSINWIRYWTSDLIKS